mmetsp:Transcript_106501/g.308182  ORF Transcript_106501/g.308182 Transcript_106501/m.308182 type:complete len:236 (+) Transcript_106501:914-1621(+)
MASKRPISVLPARENERGVVHDRHGANPSAEVRLVREERLRHSAALDLPHEAHPVVAATHRVRRIRQDGDGVDFVRVLVAATVVEEDRRALVTARHLDVRRATDDLAGVALVRSLRLQHDVVPLLAPRLTQSLGAAGRLARNRACLVGEQQGHRLLFLLLQALQELDPLVRGGQAPRRRGILGRLRQAALVVVEVLDGVGPHLRRLALVLLDLLPGGRARQQLGQFLFVLGGRDV